MAMQGGNGVSGYRFRNERIIATSVLVLDVYEPSSVHVQDLGLKLGKASMCGLPGRHLVDLTRPLLQKPHATFHCISNTRGKRNQCQVLFKA